MEGGSGRQGTHDEEDTTTTTITMASTVSLFRVLLLPLLYCCHKNPIHTTLLYLISLRPQLFPLLVGPPIFIDGRYHIPNSLC